jgi:hypothetical protein
VIDRDADMSNEDLRLRYSKLCFEQGILRFFSKRGGTFQLDPSAFMGRMHCSALVIINIARMKLWLVDLFLAHTSKTIKLLFE